MLLYNVMFALIPQVNWVAHVGGLLGGFLLGYILLRSPRRNAPQPAWRLAALVALLTATALFGYLTIIHIPLS